MPERVRSLLFYLYLVILMDKDISNGVRSSQHGCFSSADLESTQAEGRVNGLVELYKAHPSLLLHIIHQALQALNILNFTLISNQVYTTQDDCYRKGH